jgi:hypothetical protein
MYFMGGAWALEENLRENSPKTKATTGDSVFG